MKPTKQELQHICGYLPYGLKIKINGLIGTLIWISRDAIGLRMEFQIDQSSTYSLQDSIKPILNRIEDMSTDQLIELHAIKYLHIQDVANYVINVGNFYYSNHIDIHNLIDSGLAVDAKTIQP